jgi:hypothetical protein
MLEADINAAKTFVLDHGTAVEKARLAVLTGSSAAPIAAAVEEFGQSQRRDGGWAPFWHESASSVDAACFTLAQLEQLGASAPAIIAAAVRYLQDQQHDDGYFHEAFTLTADAPKWARPGHFPATVYLTANAALWLTYYDAESSTAVRARNWLLQHAEAGRLPGYGQSTWLFAASLLCAGQQAAAQPLLEFLVGQVDNMDAGSLSWMGTSLIVGQASPAHPLLHRVAAALTTKQGDDGGWHSADEAWQDVYSTLEAIRILLYHKKGRPR